MTLDAVTKDLFRSLPRVIIQQITGTTAREIRSLEFATARVRRPDLIVRLANGRILSVEIQTRIEPGMPWRMLGYRVMFHEALPGEESVEQVVLLLGGDPRRMPCAIQQPGLQFGYRVVSMQEFNAEQLLASSSVDEAVFAILCKGGTEASLIRRLLERCAREPRGRRRDLIEQVALRSGLSQCEPRVRKDRSRMPILLEDLMENQFSRDAAKQDLRQGLQKGLQEGLERGLEQGKRDSLLRILKRRLGAITPAQHKRISMAGSQKLDAWLDGAVTARSITGLLRSR